MANEIKIGEAIKAIDSAAEFSTIEHDVDTINWITTPIAKEDILAKQVELQAEYDAQDYARKRQLEYPNIYDYIDGIVKNDQTQKEKYIADAQDVKARHPKGG